MKPTALSRRLCRPGIGQMFQIDHVERRDGKTWICLSQDPFLSMRQDSLSELLRPHRSFEGPATFEIVPSVVSGPVTR